MEYQVIDCQTEGSELPGSGAYLMIWVAGGRSWFLDGKLHRTDGPAEEYGDGVKLWLQHGRCRNIHGPAMLYSDGKVRYYINGQFMSYDTWLIEREPLLEEELREEIKDMVI